MQCCRYFVYPVLIGGFTAVAVKIAVKWKITLRGLGDICRIFYEKRSRSRTPYVRVHKVCISYGLLAFCYDAHCHFFRAEPHTSLVSRTCALRDKSLHRHILSRKNTKFEYCLRTEYIPNSRHIKGYFWLVEFSATNFHAFYRDTILNLFCNNRNVLLLWCGVWILIRS
jgi:hypothetical protein